jgi:hypothetical protein
MQTTTQVDRRGKRPARSRAAWLDEVKRWRSSGQRAEAYARSHGLHPGTLAFWASRLRHEFDGKSTRRTSGERPAFLPVRVSSKTNARKCSLEQAGGGEFEVVLTNGRRVRFSGAYPMGALGQVLAAVEGGAAC